MADAVPPPAKLIPPAGSNADSPLGPKPTVDRRLPFLLDFYPLQDSKQTRLSPFFDALKSGRLTTTQCPSGHLTWPPRVVCPHCHSEALTWVDLPHHGRIYAFSAVLAGPPMGIESELPFVVGLVDLDGSRLRLFGRIVGTPWNECRIGQAVEVETYELSDGRAFYRFRTSGR